MKFRINGTIEAEYKKFGEAKKDGNIHIFFPNNPE